MTTKTARYLTRFEDAEVSRQQLLALQKHPLKGQPTIAEKVLEKHQSKRLKKRLRGKGGRISAPKKIGKKRWTSSETIKGRPKVEEDLEVMRDKQRAAKAETERKERELTIQQQRDVAEDMSRQRELDIADRTQQTILAAAGLRYQIETQRLTHDVTREMRIAAEETMQRRDRLLISQADLAERRRIADRIHQDRLTDRQAQAHMEDRRQNLAVQQIAAGHLEGRRQRGLEHRRVNEEARRYNADIEDRRRQRVADTLRHRLDLEGVQAERVATGERHAADLEGIRERVAREDERRAQEQGQQFELAARELAERGAGRQREQENERFKIESQRAVDAGRTETDREHQETLRRMLTLLQRQGGPEFFHTGGSGGGGGGSGLPELRRAVEDVGERSLERQRSGTPPPTSPLSLEPASGGSGERRRLQQLEQLGGVPFDSPQPERGGGGGETASQRALRIRETPISPGTPTRWGGGGQPYGGMGQGRIYQVERELQEQSTLHHDEPSQPRLWVRDPTAPEHRLTTPASAQQPQPGELRAQPTQERIHNVGGSEDDRPEGLDRTGRGQVERLDEDGNLGDEFTDT